MIERPRGHWHCDWQWHCGTRGGTRTESDSESEEAERDTLTPAGHQWLAGCSGYTFTGIKSPYLGPLTGIPLPPEGWQGGLGGHPPAGGGLGGRSPPENFEE